MTSTTIIRKLAVFVHCQACFANDVSRREFLGISGITLVKSNKTVAIVCVMNNWNNAQTRYEKYNHPLWKWYQEEGVRGGHDGMDWLVFRAFFESAMEQAEPPIDVYDAAAWMSISALSEQSIAMGGMPVAIPDFTRGKWIKQQEKNQIAKYRLDTIEK